MEGAAMDFKVFDPSEANEQTEKLTAADVRFLTSLVEKIGIERATQRLILRLDEQDRERVRRDGEA